MKIIKEAAFPFQLLLAQDMNTSLQFVPQTIKIRTAVTSRIITKAWKMETEDHRLVSLIDLHRIQEKATTEQKALQPTATTQEIDRVRQQVKETSKREVTISQEILHSTLCKAVPLPVNQETVLRVPPLKP